MSAIEDWVYLNDDKHPLHPLERVRYWHAGGVLEFKVTDEAANLLAEGMPSLYFNVPPWVAAAFLAPQHEGILKVILAAWRDWPETRPAHPKVGTANVLEYMLADLK